MQIAPGPVGLLLNCLRGVLDPWLDDARWKQSQGRVTFGYRFLSEDVPAMNLRLQVETNIREHFAVLGFTKRSYSVDSWWHSGMADISTFELDELLAAKLRALYQRLKGRDLFDLAMGLADERSDAGRIVAVFSEHLEREDSPVTHAMFERNLSGKIGNAQFNADMSALLRPGLEWRPAEAARTVSERLVPLLPDGPRKGGTGAQASCVGRMLTSETRDAATRIPLEAVLGASADSMPA